MSNIRKNPMKKRSQALNGKCKYGFCPTDLEVKAVGVKLCLLMLSSCLWDSFNVLHLSSSKTYRAFVKMAK